MKVAKEVIEKKEVWEREELLTGCQAVAHAVRLADVDVIAAYPIRPYTEVMDLLSKLIADGELDAEYLVAD
ncbi:MAG TPA: pyruvate ferredoxin oxidoreductase, partial [Vicinamibacteria bacterium]|nr:pyruvate ferredoxin oxidoreductase [Vicinamibacteria bacterium]